MKREVDSSNDGGIRVCLGVGPGGVAAGKLPKMSGPQHRLFPVWAISSLYPGIMRSVRRPPRLLRSCLPAFLILIVSCVGRAAAPVLEHFYPVALQRGTTNTVAAIGKFDPWPVEFRVEGQGITLAATTNKGVLEIVVAPEAAVGTRLVHAFNSDGASAPRFLVVTAEPQLAEAEPNDERAKAQVVTNTPAWLNGRLDKGGDVDQFAVELAAGQTLVATLQAYVLQSPVDAALRLHDPRGVEVQFNHDDGRTLDPQLIFTAERAGRHTLQVFGFAHPAGSEVRFTGNDRCVYRLQLATGPVVGHTLPLGLQHGVTNRLQPVGWNLGAAGAKPVSVFPAEVPTNAVWWTPMLRGVEWMSRLPMGWGPELLEHEPNANAAAALEVPVPGAVTGTIDPAGDVDRFGVAVKKDERFAFAVQAAALGFPLDAWLAVENAEGKELARNDDATSADPQLEWTAPADGRFVLAVGSLLRRGGGDQLYRLSVARAQPEFRATVEAAAFTVTAGATNEVKLTVARLFGHSGKLNAVVSGLPPDVTATPVEIAEKAGDATLRLVAATNAPAFSGPLRITVAGDGQERLAVFALATTGENNGVPQGFTDLLVRETDSLWLTVLPPKSAEPKPAEVK